MSHLNPNQAVNAPAVTALNIDLHRNPRALINAVQANQTPARKYTRVRIFPIVMWTLISRLEDDAGRELGQILVERRQVQSIKEGGLQTYTMMKQTLVGDQLDQITSINHIVEANVLGYSEQDMHVADFQSELLGIYDTEEDGKPMLVVAVLLNGELDCASHENLDRTKRGWEELLEHQVDGMSEHQFDPPILRRCIFDAFARLQ